MTQTIIYSTEERERRRRPQLKPTPPVNDLRLIPRDLQMLSTISVFGGVLTTVQLAMLFFGPDLRRRLLMWHSDRDRVGEWLARYDERHLYEKVELLKWCLKVNRLRRSGKPSRTDKKLWAWLVGLEQHDPTAWAELNELCQTVAAASPSVWLERAIETDSTPPQAYHNRPRTANEFVSSACKQRLRYLLDGGLLDPEQPATKLEEGRAQTCWFLSRAGRELVAQMHKVTPKELDWKPVGSYGLLHLSHRLAVNDFRIALQLACGRRGYTIRRWLDDNELKRLLAREKVSLQRAVRDSSGEAQIVEEQHALKIPDGFFWLDMGEGNQRHCWFEFDNQQLTIHYTHASAKDYTHKIRTMSAFYRQGRYKALFPEAGDSMWYLTVTSGSHTRLEHLKSAAEKVIGSQNKALDRYWFASNRDLATWENYFSMGVLEPIWQRAGQDRCWRLDEEV